MADNPGMAYIGRKWCGHVVAAVVDDPDHKSETSQAVANFINRGLTIEHVTNDYVRDNFHACNCPDKEPKQMGFNLRTRKEENIDHDHNS